MKAFVCCIVGMVLVWVGALCARAQSFSPAWHDDTLLLAQACVHEAGFDAIERGDCSGIRVVLERVGVGDIARGIERYMPLFAAGRSPRRWVYYLNRAGTEPLFWPENVSWRAMQPRWQRLLEGSSELLSTRAMRCSAAPHHWGDRHGDLRRAQRAGWRPVDCSSGALPTRNLFWRVVR